MSTQTEIVNLALTFLGAGRITDLADVNDPLAREYRDIYDITVRAEFERHNWRFAIKRATLTAVDPLTSGITDTSAFLLPNNCARIVAINDRCEDSWDNINREGKYILVWGASSISLRYVAHDVPEGDWPRAFQRVVAAALADTRAESSTKSVSKAGFAESRYDRELKAALRAQAIERRFDRDTYSPSLEAHIGMGQWWAPRG